MAHCTECEYRERLRRIKALPAEANRRIREMRKAIGFDRDGYPRKIEPYELANIASNLYEWVYGVKSVETVNDPNYSSKRSSAFLDLVSALYKVQVNITLF
jgi:hypothetical protein